MTYDFTLRHGWGGSYAIPETPEARSYIDVLATMISAGPFQVDDDGDLCCDHKDGLDMARMLHEQGFTFKDMDKLEPIILDLPKYEADTKQKPPKENPTKVRRDQAINHPTKPRQHWIINKALQHVRSFHPDVIRVTFTKAASGRILAYYETDSDTLTRFADGISQKILNDAVNEVARTGPVSITYNVADLPLETTGEPK